MTPAPQERFELRQVAVNEWSISDHRYDAHDERCVVACIWWVAVDECEVSWMIDLGLPTRYRSPAEVIEDLRLRMPRRTKPIPIAHFAPPTTRPTPDPG